MTKDVPDQAPARIAEKSAIQLPPPPVFPPAGTLVDSPAQPIGAVEDLVGVMQHVATVLEQAINNRRLSWGKLVYLGACHAKAISYVDMLRGYRQAGEAAISYLDEDLQNLLTVPNLADQMQATLQGKAKLNAALHFLHGLDADLTRD
jgi:hypothetical protein